MTCIMRVFEWDTNMNVNLLSNVLKWAVQFKLLISKDFLWAVAGSGLFLTISRLYL